MLTGIEKVVLTVENFADVEGMTTERSRTGCMVGNEVGLDEGCLDGNLEGVVDGTNVGR